MCLLSSPTPHSKSIQLVWCSRCRVCARGRRWNVRPDASEPSFEADRGYTSASSAIQSAWSIEIVATESGGDVVVCALGSRHVSERFRKCELRLKRCGILVCMERQGSPCLWSITVLRYTCEDGYLPRARSTARKRSKTVRRSPTMVISSGHLFRSRALTTKRATSSAAVRQIVTFGWLFAS